MRKCLAVSIFKLSVAMFLVPTIPLAQAQSQPNNPHEATALSVNTAGMSHEEAVVRRCYVKLSYLTQQTVYADAALQVEREWKAADPIATQALAAKSLISYQISNVHTGPLSEIAGKAWGDVVDAPANDLLLPSVHISGQTWNEGNEPQFFWNRATVSWETTQQPSVPDDIRKAWLAHTVTFMLALAGTTLTYPDVTYTRYATYTVVATFQGKSVGPYKAIFLFGHNTESGEVDAPVDLFANASSLFQANTNPFYPQYLNSHLREITILHDWILAQQIQCGFSGICCVSDRCGINQSDVSIAFATPLSTKYAHGEANPSNPGETK